LFCRQRRSRFVDATFVENILSEEFLPELENAELQNLRKAAIGSDALLWHRLSSIEQATLAIGKSSQSILNFVAVFVASVDRINRALHQIAGGQAEFEQILLSLCSKFVEYCDAILRSLVNRSATSNSKDPVTAISYVLSVQPKLLELLLRHPSMLADNDTGNHQLIAESEVLLIEKLKSDRSFQRNELIFDARVLRTLVLLQRSLVSQSMGLTL